MEGREGSERPLIVAIPEVLTEKLGSEGARALAELLNDVSMQTRGDVIEIAAGRFERRLAEELAKLHTRLRAEMDGLRSEMGDLRGRMGDLRGQMGDLRAEMGAFEGRITRWMFIFWVGQVGALLGILFAFFRT